MSKKIILLFLFLGGLYPSKIYPANPICTPECGGCAMVLPAVLEISRSITKEYDSYDSEMAKLTKTLFDLYKANRKLNLKISKNMAEVAEMEKQILKLEMGISDEMKKIKQLESTREISPVEP